MAHFQIPLDLPHAGRLADRILNLIQRYLDETGKEADEVVEAAERLSRLLFPYSANDENPPEEEASRVREEAASAGRELVDAMESSGVTGDRMGQYVRNLFECLELGEEGSVISLRAGENPNSLQRPV
ncbi:MAG TPA: hypothetical protein VFL80_10075 [Thermoanaerobaculia bacterium]|nr:hypothetical protein [Thermoanaerobaculia bacterium]